MKETIKTILLVFGLLLMGWIGYSYKGSLPIEDNSSIALKDLVPSLVPIIFIWICYKVYELNKRVRSIESKLEEYTKKDKDIR